MLEMAPPAPAAAIPDIPGLFAPTPAKASIGTRHHGTQKNHLYCALSEFLTQQNCEHNEWLTFYAKIFRDESLTGLL
jgi:hypothetical protein